MSSSTIKQNTTELQEIFDAINNLPEAGSAPNAKEEQTKSLDVTKNGNYNILPDSGKVLSKATVKVDVKNTDTVDGWHVAVRNDGSDPPSGIVNTITFVYGG